MSLEILTTVLISTLFPIISIICLYKWRFTYWKKKKIPGPTPMIPVGNSQNPFTRTESPFEHLKRRYDEMKAKNHKHCGLYVFTRPIYVPIDLEYIKNIMTRDFHHFTDRGVYYNEKVDPLSKHLISLEGENWKNLRSKLTPTFTSGKMKLMFETIVNCADHMVEAIENLCENSLDIKEICSCFTTDVIGLCAFGLECNSFKQKNSEFRKYGRKVFTPSIKGVIRILFSSAFPKLAKLLRVRAVDADVSAFFTNIIHETINYRQENNIKRKDFLQLLLELEKVNELNVAEVTAQAFLFFLAGFETSSTTMTSCIYELAVHGEIQGKLREEIKTFMCGNGGKLTYENLMEMKYLNQVVEETLRKYPSIPIIQRSCTRDYKIPGCEATLEKGTQIRLPVFAIHRDPEYYPDPDKFDPERFSDTNKATRSPITYLPFGEGPRICIGQRFGLMQVKIGLVALINNYKILLNQNTIIPIEFNQNGFITSFKNIVWVDFIKIKQNK